MADKQELVYQINIDIEQATRKMDEFQQKLKGVGTEITRIQSQGKQNGIESSLSKMQETATTTAQQLSEVRRAIDLISQGYVVMKQGSTSAYSIDELRTYEKALTDLQSLIKNTSFDAMAKSQKKALDEMRTEQEKYFNDLRKQAVSSLVPNESEIRKSTEAHKKAWADVAKEAHNAQLAQNERIKQAVNSIYPDEKRISTVSNAIKQQMQERINEENVIANLEKRYNRLNEAMNRSISSNKAMPESTYYSRRNQMNDIIEKMGGGLPNVYNGSYGEYRAPIDARNLEIAQQRQRIEANINESINARNAREQASVNSSKERAKAEQDIQRIIERQNIALERGQKTTEADRNLSMRQFTQANASYRNNGGRTEYTAPFSRYANAQEQNIAMMARNAQAWAKGYSSYSSELQRLTNLQQALYAAYRNDPTPQVTTALRNVSAQIRQTTADYQRYNSVLGTANEKRLSFANKMRSHLYWITVGATLGAMFAIPSETIHTLVQLDEEMHNLATVMPQIEGKSSEAIAKYQEEQRALINTARAYGESVKDVMESARLWGRMYKDQATVNTLVSQSAKLAVADNFSMAESTKAVEAAMFQYGLIAKNSAEALAYSNKIVDVYTKLSHNAGVSAQDLAAGVERSGAVAKQAGISFEFLNALIAQGTRATALSGSEIGNMLKTMLASFNSDKAVKELNKLGIATTETVNGVKKVRSAQAVLMDVAVAAQGTNKDLKDLWIQMSGGKFQWAKAAAMFSNYQEIIKNWGFAVNSMGFTDNQVKNQMDSLSRRINKLKADLTGMVAQGGNSGLTQWLKECVTELDNLAKFLSTVSASTYHFIGSFTKLLMIMYLVNKAMRLLRTSLNMITVSGASATITSMSTAFASATTTAEGLKAAIIALKNSISLLKAAATFGASLAIDLGLEALTGYIDNTTNAVEKQTEAVSNDMAVKRQQIEMYNQQEDFLDALFVAHQKLTAEIESSTVSDKKKKKLLEDRIETENQMANVVGWSAVQQMQADNWTDESTKKVRDNYKKATDDKKKALAEFIAAKQEESIVNYQTAIKNMENWKQETHEFCLGMSDRIKSISDYTDSLAIAYAVLAKFDEHRASALDSRLSDLEEKKQKLSELAADPDYKWNEMDSQDYNDISDQIESVKAEQGKVSKDLYNHRYNAEFYESGKSIMKNYEAAKSAFENLGGSALTNPGNPIDPNELLQKWGSGEGVGGDEYNHTPSGKSKHNKGRTKKDPKEDWQYGDTTSQMFAELSKKFEATFDTRNGLDIAALSAIVTKLTGINTLEFDGVSDPFGTGGRNTWESGRLFYEKMAPYLAQGLTVAQALGHLTPGITEEEWKTWLNDKGLFLRNHYDYNKNDQRFSDPNEQPGGLYDLGGAPTSGGGDEDYVGNDVDEGHLWELAVIAANQAKVVKDPLYYWLIMMHESGRGKDGTSVANHNFAGLGGGAGVDMKTDANFASTFARKLDGMFTSAPNNIGELVYGMYTHGYFEGDAEAYQSDLEGIKNEGLVSGGNKQTATTSSAPIGDAVYDEALKESAERKGEALGANTCAAFVSYVTRGIGANTGIDDPLVKNWVDKAQASGAWVDSSSGQTAPKGSLVVWSREGEQDGNPWMHIGISDGQGGWISSDTHGLKHHTGLDSYYSGNGYNYAGYIDMAKLTGGQTVSGYATPRKPSFWNGRKSTLADFTRDQIAETIYDQDRQQKLYEAQKKNIEYQMKIHGNTYELLRANDANEKAYYEAVEKNRKGWIDTYDNLTDSITDYINEHVEIKNKLDGKNIFDMPQDELRKLADLTGKGDNEFKKLVENLFKVREQLSNADSKLVELRAAEKIRNGYMKPEQDEDFRLKRLEEWYNRTTSNKTDGEKYMDTHELYQSQIDIYNERLKRQREDLMNIRRRDQEQLEEYYESLDDLQNGKYNDKGELVEKGLAQLNGDNTDEAKDKIAELKAKVKDLKENIDQLSKHGSEDFQKIQKEVEETEAKIREIAEKDDEVTKNLWSTIESDIDDMFFDIIKQGSSFKESWKKLWDDVAKIALQQIMRMTVNRWLFNARTTIDDAISNRNTGKNAAINAGAGLLANNASRFTTTPKRWTQVTTGNRYLDMYNGTLNGNYFPMKSSGEKLATPINKSIQATSQLSSVTQKATALTNVSNTLTQTSNLKDTMNTTAVQANTVTGQANTLQMQALTEAMLMAGSTPSISLGGHAMGGLLSRAYANGGMIRGAGTGKSDSILAYLADKDRFVFLSNGEYVMTAEATSRIGKDNLDAMNYGAFADGGALNPTPYVPQISPRVAKRAEGVRVTNPNARMEQLMQEQTDTIKNMGNSDGSGNVVVLNTHASSDDVMNAIQRNPRAFQSILHNQKRHGFR